MLRIGKLGTVLLALVATVACTSAPPKTSADVRGRAKQRHFSSAGEPQKLEDGTWKVDVTFGGTRCSGTLFFDAKGGVVLEWKAVRVEDPDVSDDLYDDPRFKTCFTKD